MATSPPNTHARWLNRRPSDQVAFPPKKKAKYILYKMCWCKTCMLFNLPCGYYVKWRSLQFGFTLYLDLTKNFRVENVLLIKWLDCYILFLFLVRTSLFICFYHSNSFGLVCRFTHFICVYLELFFSFHLSQVIATKDIIRPPKKDAFNDVYIVYELMDTDLHQIIRSDQQLTDDRCQVWHLQNSRGFIPCH